MLHCLCTHHFDGGACVLVCALSLSAGLDVEAAESRVSRVYRAQPCKLAQASGKFLT